MRIRRRTRLMTIYIFKIRPVYNVLRYFGAINRFSPINSSGRIQKIYQVCAKFSSSTSFLAVWEAGNHAAKTKDRQIRLYKMQVLVWNHRVWLEMVWSAVIMASIALEKLLIHAKTAQTAKKNTSGFPQGNTQSIVVKKQCHKKHKWQNKLCGNLKKITQ